MKSCVVRECGIAVLAKVIRPRVLDSFTGSSRIVGLPSPMPSNLADTLPEEDFYDLLAFLLAQRQKKD